MTQLPPGRIHASAFKTERTAVDMRLSLALGLRLWLKGGDEIVFWAEHRAAHRTDPRTQFSRRHLENLLCIKNGPVSRFVVLRGPARLIGGLQAV